MRIIGVDYTLNNLSLNIYIAGCRGVNGAHCNGCHNPSTWNFDQGVHYTEALKSIRKYVSNDYDIIDNIMIFGGEPLDQNKCSLIDFLKELQEFRKSVWLFTRYEFKDVDSEIIGLLNYVKCGYYDELLRCDDNVQFGVSLSTSNQKIHKLS